MIERGKTNINHLDNRRHSAFVDWIATFLPDSQQIERPIELQPLAGDAGFRRYFRVVGQPSLIAVDSPPTKEKNQAYIAVSVAFQRYGIVTPKIFAVDFANGFFLLEDFGTRLLQPELSATNTPAAVAERYSQAEAILMEIQRAVPEPRVFPLYDRHELQTEMDLFSQWFVSELLGITLDKNEQQMLQQMARDFAASEIQPNAESWDRESSFPRDAIRKAHDLGLLTVKIPEEFGGFGMGSFEEVLICEEFGWGDPGFATACGSTMLASYPVITGCTHEGPSSPLYHP